MAWAFLVIFTLSLLVSACEFIPGAGACYRADNGDKITHLLDAEGTKWRISRVDATDPLGQPMTFCGVSRNAKVFVAEGEGRFGGALDYLTDETGETKFYVMERIHGEFIFRPWEDFLDRSRVALEWY